MLAGALALFAFVRLAVLRWQTFATNAFDLAFFDQIIFNTSRGRWFENSFVAYNFAGQHLEPILLAYVPAYWLGAGPLLLTTSQAVVAALAAFPLYFFARRLTGNPGIACAAVVAYLANPYLHRAVAFDFHPEVMVAFPVFTAMWAIATGRRRTAVAAGLAVLLFKEDAAFLALFLGGVMWAKGMRREGGFTASVAVAYALLAVFVIMPLMRGGQESDLVERYQYLLPGQNGDGFAVGALLMPIRAGEVLFAIDQLQTAGLFLATSAAAAALRPAWLVWLAPALLLTLLSQHPQQRALELHYAVGMVPIATVLALLAIDAVRGRVLPQALGFALVAPPIVAMMFLNPLGAGLGEAPSTSHRSAVHAAIALVPADEDVSVSAQSGLLPRLSQRREAYEFPGHAEDADWVVVDRYGFRSSQSLAAGFDRRLEELRQTAELVYSVDGVEVFRRMR
ncbi:MAG: DUF2079 domain-containing protein [Dehalococcoidia bacterium]